jgi:hypothetical protein
VIFLDSLYVNVNARQKTLQYVKKAFIYQQIRVLALVNLKTVMTIIIGIQPHASADAIMKNGAQNILLGMILSAHACVKLREFVIHQDGNGVLKLATASRPSRS